MTECRHASNMKIYPRNGTARRKLWEKLKRN
nr:MAG TPA: hypothetical protein [Caudoviricetes sp.]